MSVKKRGRYPLDAKAPALVADYVGGMAAPELATKYGVTRQSIHSFLGRHVGEIETLREQVRAELAASTIVTKRERVAALEQLWSRQLDLIETRKRRHGAQYPTLDIGELEVVDVKVDNMGGEHYVVHFDHQLSKELRGTARDIAEEQGEIVRKSESVISVPEDADGNARPIPLVIYRAASESKPKP